MYMKKSQAAASPKKSKTGMHMLEGALAGVVLAVAAGLFLRTKIGKKVTVDIRDRSAEFYKQLAPQLKKAKELSQAQFHKLIDTSLVSYAKAKKLSSAEINELTREARSSWSHLKKNLQTARTKK